MRGQDKLALSVHGLLSKPLNTGVHVPDIAVNGYCYKAFPKWRSFMLEKLVAAYFTLVQRFVLQSCHTQRESTVGDVIHFDCSRVACREVMLVTMLINGNLVSLPLQVIPDQPAVLDVSAAVQEVSDKMLEKKKKGRSSEYQATRLTFVAVAHAILQVFPFVSLGPWRATSTDTCAIGSETHVDQQTGFAFRVAGSQKEARWCLPVELRRQGDSKLVASLCYIQHSTPSRR